MKKFKISLIVLLAVIVSVNFYSCNKDSLSEEDAMKLQTQLYKDKSTFDDSVNTQKVRITYTVSLVDAATSTLKSAKDVSGVSGATVTLTQNGVSATQTTSATGMAVFSKLKMGTATVNVTLANYSEVNYVVNFASLGTSGVSGGLEFGNIIPMIALTGTTTGVLKGTVTYESDLTNKAPEAVSGALVIATVSTSSAALPGTGGLITNISYGNLSLSATTDATGAYTMTVPATSMGLDFAVRVSDFAVNQTLLMYTVNGTPVTTAQSILTNFGSNASSSASSLPNVVPVVVTIGAPDYTFTPAVAAAIIDNSNAIDHIDLTNNGGLYTANTGYTIPLDMTAISNSSTVIGGATFNVNSFGRVTNISVSAGGSAYLTAAEGYTLSIPYVQTEAVVTISTVAAGVITGFTITNAGRYYTNVPANVYFLYNGSGGSGAILTANFTLSGGAYTISSVNIVNGGTGYSVAAGNTFNIKNNISSPQMATGILHLTAGVVSAITVSNEGANYLSSPGVDVTIGAPNVIGGVQATASATVSGGKITAITIGNPTTNTGYTSAPLVTITNKVKTVQAQAYATVTAAGVVSALTLETTATTPAVPADNNGYIAVPTVTITPQASGIGSGAVFTAVVSGGAITSFTQVSGGTGYTGSNFGAGISGTGTTAGTAAATSTSASVKGNATTITNIYLGTGKRTIEQ